MSDLFNQFLGLVSAPLPSERRGQRLHALARGLDWDQLLPLAVEQRVAPLLYWHLREHGIACPGPIRRTLAAIVMRQRSIAAVQTSTLGDISDALCGAGIEFVVLKGGALAHLLYSEPALRPMDDLDLLVSPAQGEAARQALCQIGFDAPAPVSRYDRLLHHFPIAQRITDGILVGVELHTSAFNSMLAYDLSFGTLARPLTPYQADGRTLQALAPVQMLWMQYHGLRKLVEPVRFIHISDLVGLAERFVDTLDWPQVQARYAALWGAFSAVHALSPLGDRLCGCLGFDPDRSPEMSRLGVDYRGWPRFRFSQQREGQGWRLLHETLGPSEWWLRFVYGIPIEQSLSRARLHRHPLALISQIVRRLYRGPANGGGLFQIPL
jgi:hypothetical protein